MRLRALILGSLLGAVGIAQASDVPAPFRIPIRHADPWTVKAMIEGIAVRSPENSSLPGFQGLGQATQAAAGLLASGKLVVNPTDNSLWYFPSRS